MSASFERLYETELLDMVNIATYFLGSRHQAEDVVQESFMQVHKSWKKVRKPRSFLKKVVVNRCKDLMKTEHNRRVREDFVHSSEPNELNHYLVDLLQKLETRRRFVIVLKFYGGYKIKEIAKILDIPKGTVESNLHRGINQLAAMLENHNKNE